MMKSAEDRLRDDVAEPVNTSNKRTFTYPGSAPLRQNYEMGKRAASGGLEASARRQNHL
jgi:hypothetical protein